jgi:DNA-directed RNA polymerase specialized sigma subunit
MGREQDLIAWQEWRQNPNAASLHKVLMALDPLIQNEVNRWAGSLARPLVEIEAKKLAVEAIETYRPNMGAALATHVTNRLKKLSRLTYTHQAAARTPEYQTLQYNSFRNAELHLEERFGRPPTADELTDELGWSKPYLSKFQKTMRSEFAESGGQIPIFDQTSDDSKMIDYIYNDLAPKQKFIFQHTTGYSGSPILTNKQLMQRTKFTQGQLSYQKRLLIDKIHSTTGGGVS